MNASLPEQILVNTILVVYASIMLLGFPYIAYELSITYDYVAIALAPALPALILFILHKVSGDAFLMIEQPFGICIDPKAGAGFMVLLYLALSMILCFLTSLITNLIPLF